jgi:predicted dehydrogenase
MMPAYFCPSMANSSGVKVVSSGFASRKPLQSGAGISAIRHDAGTAGPPLAIGARERSAYDPISVVKIAIVGCGLATEELHLPAALASRELEVAALVDTDIERARRLTRKFGINCQVAGTIKESILERVEGVLIVTPNHTHAPIARAILQSRRPVLVEKPLTVTCAEALDLCDLASQVGSFVSVGFVTRHYPVVPLFKKLFEDGFFGRPKSFHFEYGTKGGWAPLSGYTLSRAQSGGGVLVTNGTHFIDRMLYWFGYPRHFRYADDSAGGPEANCRAWIDFDGGLSGTLQFSKTMGLKNRFTMVTDRYAIDLPYSEPNQLTLSVPDNPNIVVTVRGTTSIEAPDAFRLQLEEFGRAIRYGHSVTVPGEAGMLSVQLCEEFYAKRQPLPEPWAWYAEPAKA